MTGYIVNMHYLNKTALNTLEWENNRFLVTLKAKELK